MHCTSRVVNIFIKRLTAQFPQAGRLVQWDITRLTRQAQSLPFHDRLAPRLTKEGSLDLTASTLFVRDIELHARIVQHARDVDWVLEGPFGKLTFFACITILLRSLHGLHQFWSQREPFSPPNLSSYRFLATHPCPLSHTKDKRFFPFNL